MVVHKKEDKGVNKVENNKLSLFFFVLDDVCFIIHFKLFIVVFMEVTIVIVCLAICSPEGSILIILGTLDAEEQAFTEQDPSSIS